MSVILDGGGGVFEYYFKDIISSPVNFIMTVGRWSVGGEVPGEIIKYLIIKKCLYCILHLSQEID